MRRLLLSVMLYTSCLCIQGQSASPFFYYLFADYGLSSDKTTVTLQDYKGFIWFGTEEGLNRMVEFQVYDIYRYDRKDDRSLSNDHVTMLFEDSQKRFWVGTSDGLNLYDRALKKFSRISLNADGKKSSIDMIYDMAEDSDGNLWVINNQGLVLMDGETLRPSSQIVAEGRSGGVLKLNDLELHQTNLWVATSDGLYELRGKKLLTANVGKGSEVSSLLAINDKLWLGTVGDGLMVYDATTGDVDVFTETSEECKLNSNYINDVALVDGDQVWVATMDGINVFSPKRKLIDSYQYSFDDPYSLSDKAIQHLYQDEAGSVWIATPNSGINYFHKADNLFSYFGQTKEEGTENDLMDYSTFSIVTTDEGNLWIGSRKGVSSYNSSTNKFNHFPFTGDLSNKIGKVMSIAQCSADNLWLGTDNGLVKWTAEGQSYEYIMPEQLNGLDLLTVMGDEEDNLWIGSASNGVKLYSSRNKVLRDIPFEGENSGASGESKISDIKKFGDLILVSTNNGLFQYENGALVKVSLKGLMDGLPNDIPINAIYQDAQEHIWLGTQQDGIIVLNEKQKYPHRQKVLRSLNIHSVKFDSPLSPSVL